MNKQELSHEIERLHRELEASNQSRERLRDLICAILPVDRTEMTPEEFENLKKSARPVNDLLRDILPPEMRDHIHEH